MDHEMLNVLERARRANGRVTRLIAVGGRKLRRAKAAREVVEAEFEALCTARTAETREISLGSFSR